MVTIIYQKSIKEISQLIGNEKKAVPAGGTTIAINGLLGISLLKLTFHVSNIDLSNKQKEKFENKFNKAEKILLTSMDQDIQAFETNLESNFNDKENLKKIIETPLKIAKTVCSILDLTRTIEDDIKNNVAADFEVARENLKTSIKGAVTIIESNYNFFNKSDKYINEVNKKVTDLKKYI